MRAMSSSHHKFFSVVEALINETTVINQTACDIDPTLEKWKFTFQSQFVRIWNEEQNLVPCKTNASYASLEQI